MTEKRFEIIKSTIIDGARVIKDNENKYTFATTFETATLINYRKALNELNDENEQLNKKLRIYKSDGLETLNDLQRCYENTKKSMKRIDVLEEENEQLKNIMIFAYTLLSKNTIDDDEYFEFYELCENMGVSSND